LRSGNTGAAQGALQFLSERSSARWGNAHQVRSVRAESGFYADSFLQFLEERSLPSSFIVVARLTTYLKSRLHQLASGKPLIPSTR
jgi:hypothetical protein